MKSKRIDAVEKYIHKKKKVSLKELEKNFDLSMNTVRRYVKTLLDKGNIIKVYGGVESIRDLDEEEVLVDVNKRNILNITQKKIIAEKAAKYIDDGDRIYIDSGTTTAWILDYVDKNINLTIITNNLDVINKAAKLPNVNIILSGNNYRKRINAFVKLGNHTVLDKINIHKSFMAASSVTKDSGVMNNTVEEYELKSNVISKCLVNYLLVDESKFNNSGFIKYAEVEDFKAIITTAMEDVALKDYLEFKGVEVIEVR
ncbi:MAG: DeoR/GlpR family DNA-binding transcription regulator [Gemella sp.]|nr:DeoR/GlpR family DNA-binding transcription regulator [Gemella sp.]